jgi:hypothetical protein
MIAVAPGEAPVCFQTIVEMTRMTTAQDAVKAVNQHAN